MILNAQVNLFLAMSISDQQIPERIEDVRSNNSKNGPGSKSKYLY